MSKSLKTRLKMLAAGVGLAGAITGSSGCFGPMMMGVGAARNDPGLYAWGAGMTSVESANAGRSQTNVTVTAPGQPIQQTNLNYFDGRMADGTYYRGGIVNDLRDGEGIAIVPEGKWNLKGEARMEGTFKSGRPYNVTIYQTVGGRTKLIGHIRDGEEEIGANAER